MASSTVPTLKLDGRNWKVFWASLLKAAATKGWLGILSGQETNNEIPIPLVLKIRNLRTSHKMFNYLATKFQDPTPISIPTKKPIEAPNDDKTQESCVKPNKLSVEPPSEERLKDKLTEARNKGKAEAVVGAAQQTSSQSVKVKEYVPEVPSNLHTAWNELYKQPSSRAGKPLESKHLEVLNGMVKIPDEVKNTYQLKPCNRSMKNDLPDARELPLEGEQAMCMSGSPRNSNSIEDEQPRLINVNSYCYRHSMDADTSNANSGTTNGQSHYPEKPQLTIYNPGGTLQWLTASSQEVKNGESVLSMPTGHAGKANGCTRQHVPKAQRVPLEGELAGCASDSTGRASSNKRNLRGRANTSRVQGMHADGLRGQEEPIDLPVKSPPTRLRKRSYEAVRPRRQRGRIKFEARNVSRKRKGENTYQGRGSTISHAPEGTGMPRNLTVEPTTLQEGPEGVRKWRGVDTNMSSRTRGLGGQDKVSMRLGVVEGEWKCQNDGKRVETDGQKCQMDGATSSIHYDSKRVKTKLLAEKKIGQDQRQQRKLRDVPEPPKRLRMRTYEPTRPKRRRRRIKLESRKVRRTWKGENTYQGRDNAIARPREGIRTLRSLTVKSRAHWKCRRRVRDDARSAQARQSTKTRHTSTRTTRPSKSGNYAHVPHRVSHSKARNQAESLSHRIESEARKSESTEMFYTTYGSYLQNFRARNAKTKPLQLSEGNHRVITHVHTKCHTPTRGRARPRTTNRI
ncbi:hypothetical protein EV401DRAFT_1891732 [Pisolithus croceorrhizus]|nr:hypothetical protein EV401DRAFT_1891732 [Pisolithus croceorrhizus]